MTQRSIDHDTGFEDSCLLEYHRREDDTLVVLLQAWNEKTIEFEFSETVSVLEVLAGDIADVTWDDSPSELLVRALKRVYEKEPSEHPYKVFRFIALDDEPCLEIVAEACTVTTRGKGTTTRINS